MKKILAAVLAAAMTLSMGVSSFAAIGDGAKPVGPTSNPGTIGTGAYPVGPATDVATGSKSFKTADSTDIYDSDGYKLDWTDTVNPGSTYYIELDNDTSFSDWASSSANARISTKKIKNGSLVQSVALVEKKLSGSTRKSYLQVVLKDTTSSDEIRVDFSVTFTAKKDMTSTEYIFGNNGFKLNRNQTLVLNTTLYVSNENTDGGDTTVEVGKTGTYIKPIAGETNEVIFEDTNGTIATLTFDASSNPAKFYAKVTTNWTTTTIKKFQNTDAVIRTFYPATIDARSRARLALSNPYDTDRKDPTKVWIYSIDSKGKVTDVSKSFKYNSELDAYTTYLRTLGTYVISNVKVTT